MGSSMSQIEAIASGGDVGAGATYSQEPPLESRLTRTSYLKPLNKPLPMRESPKKLKV